MQHIHDHTISARRPIWRWPGLIQLIFASSWLLLLSAGNSQLVMWALVNAPRLAIQIAASGALYVLPGLAALRLARQPAAWGRLDRVALAFGISLALAPLLFELTSLIGLPWTRATTLAYIALAGLITIWPAPGRSWAALPRPRLRLSWDAVLLGGVLLSALLIRLFAVRDLDVGMWGDSYHHTIISQLLVNNAGLFSSWQPYAPLTTMTYHFGFHSHVALFHWLTGTPITQSVLVVGQIANAGAGLGAYLLTLRLTGNRAAALWAAALSLFVNTQPAFYVNWGRYTQLSGQDILPAVLALWISAIQEQPRRWPTMVLAGAVTAGIILTHYILAVIGAVFLLAYLALLLAWRLSLAERRRIVISAVVIGALAALLATPWMINVVRGNWDRQAGNFITNKASAYAASVSNLLPLAPFYLKGVLIALAAAGTWLALARRSWRTLILLVWTGLLLLLVIPGTIGLPGTGIVTNFAAALAIYMTAIPLAAYPVGLAQDWLGQRRRDAPKRRPQVVKLAAAVALVALSTWSATWQTTIIDPSFQLYTPADQAAMEWIRNSTAPDARFHVNMFPAFNDNVLAGDDGGWWIPYMTGRQTTLPPITYRSEQAESQDYAQRITQLGLALRDKPLPSPEAIALLRADGIDYIYTGPHPSTNPRIDVAALRQRPEIFPVVYDQGGVVIFALEETP